MPETFAVITINYNNLRGLKRTLESVWQQSARNQIELIVVDGQSTDGSAEFLRENAEKINSIIIEKDGGIYDAMNKGMNRSHGTYVWFVNSGDTIYDKDTTAGLLPLTSSLPGVIFGDTMFMDSDGSEVGLISKLKPQPLPDILGPDSFRYGMSVCHQSILVRRDLCGKFDLSYRQAADIDWIIKVLKKNPETIKYNGIIAGFEIGGSSYQNEKKAWRERYRVLKQHYGLIPNVLAHIWIIVRRILFKAGVWKP